MLKLSRLALIFGGAIALGACQQSGTATHSTSLDNDAQKLGYTVGYDMGESMKSIGDMIDLKSVEAGLEDGHSGTKAKLDSAARQKIKQEMSQKIREKQVADRAKAAETNLAASEKFLAEKAKEDGVKTTASGLEYKIDKAGEGATPGPDDSVTVNYKGTLPDGTVFDSSYDRGEPITFGVKDVIPGWVEGLQLMKPGAKFTFYIPPKLAYGERGAGDKIGPNQALAFEVELIKVENPKAAEAQPADTAK
ncbi:MAG: FKBP-type peptidyl-prolyl cis-trans isomerase [Nevskiaceae bacterium]|nr:MAG: FKBP-type peptidyl-prolyl cis-trans isomerase [Nevskiaceae bacterium]TBR75117.1 MAG: FKBP-type peptidyl-prolyl cis-trans isomerase [Nevskiaceae bacterium]